MLFYASKLVAALLWPSTVMLLALCAGAALLALDRARSIARILVVFGVVLLAVGGTLPIGNLMLMPLEDRFERGTAPAAPAGIIILGGFEIPQITFYRKQLAVNAAADRLIEGVRLARRLTATRVIFTGGDGSLTGLGGDAAASVGRSLEEFGIARERIVLEGISRNTFENAWQLKRILSPMPGQRYILVTTAYHMPRAVGVFRAQGFDVVPWPVDYRTRGIADIHFEIDAVPAGLQRLDIAVREWIGILAYWWLGRTQTLLPAPR